MRRIAFGHFYRCTRRNHTRINAEVTDQRSGGSRVDPRCGGNSPHPMANYLESKILKKVGKAEKQIVLSPSSKQTQYPTYVASYLGFSTTKT